MIPNLPPNEFGQIMIIGYHDIGYPEMKWRRTPENFRNDLTFLYENGFYPIPLLDYIRNEIKVPKGQTPVIITFDDSTLGQFRWIKKGSRYLTDPDCAVGIMENFERQHPQLSVTASFYVIPMTRQNVFGQPQFAKDKLHYLVDHGHEIGNHSFSHQNLRKCSDIEVQKELVRSHRALNQWLPDYKIQTLALPFGRYPHNKTLAYCGSFEGERYQHQAVLYCGSGLAPAPGTKKFDPYNLLRVQAGESPTRTAHYFNFLLRKPFKRFISDGNQYSI